MLRIDSVLDIRTGLTACQHLLLTITKKKKCSIGWNEVGYITQNYCWRETRGGGFTVKGKDGCEVLNGGYGLSTK